MKVSTGTITRLIVLLATIINMLFMLLGKDAQIPICEADIYEAVTTLSVIVVPLWSYWKNNSWTQKALEADEILAAMKDCDEEGADEDEPDFEE